MLGTFSTACENEIELTHPETIKGTRLGLNYDDQKAIAQKNRICEENIHRSSFCEYKVFEEVYARPQLLYSYYKGEKVLGEVEIVFNAPSSFVFLSDIDGNVIDYPSLQKWHIIKLKALYSEKYGPVLEQEEFSSSGYAIWQTEDMVIRMDYQESLIAYNIDYQVRYSYESDAYRTTITYKYNDEYNKLIDAGDPSGIFGSEDNI